MRALPRAARTVVVVVPHGTGLATLEHRRVAAVEGRSARHPDPDRPGTDEGQIERKGFLVLVLLLGHVPPQL